MAQPLLSFGDVGLVRQGVCSRRRAQRMNAETVDRAANAGLASVVAHNVAVDGCWVEVTVQALSRPVVLDGAEEGTTHVRGVASNSQVFLDEALRGDVYRYEADLVALASDSKMHHTFSVLNIADAEAA